MTRGTTPTLEFSIPYAASDIKNGYVTFAQHRRPVFEVGMEGLELQDGKLTLTLTQRQTLLLEPDDATVQIRLLLTGDQAVASQLMEVHVQDVLKDGVIFDANGS